MKKMDLAEAMYCVVMCATMIFFGFAAGVWAGEYEEPQPEAAPVTVVEVREPVVVDTAVRSLDCARDDKALTPVPDPMIEDTYLMPEHPLPLELQVKLYGACLEMGVDYELALAVIEQETRFRNLMGDGGESAGYMQVQEKWHKDRMALLGVDDLRDPEGNFRVGCHFLKECIDKYGLEKGLGYYNSGKAAVTDYSREVLGRMG
jgi:hypothetical protein